MSNSNIKHKLPTYSVLPHLNISSDVLLELQSLCTALDPSFQTVLEANKALCGLHHNLVTSAYDNFQQISVTESEFNSEEVSLQQCEVVHNELSKHSTSTNMRNRKLLTAGVTSPFNENTFTTKTDIYEVNKTLFDKVLSQFKGPTTRIRLVRLGAGLDISPHIDYDPSYAVRVIIPILSTKECVNIFWVKNDIVCVNLEPGKGYFLNTGYKHAVKNFSKHARYTLMVSIAGTEDIQHLLQYE